MKGISFAVAAICLYAIQAAVIERKLAQVSPLANMGFFYLGMIAVLLPILLLRNQLGMSLVMPQGNQYWFIAVCGVVLFAADFCYFSAYNSGMSLIAITTIAALMPVFASVIKFAAGGGAPSITQVVGWIFAFVAVFLVSKG